MKIKKKQISMVEPKASNVAPNIPPLSGLTAEQRRQLRRHVSAGTVGASAFKEEQAGYANRSGGRTLSS